MENGKDLAYLSKTLGTIDINADIEKELNLIRVQKWNNEAVLDIFKKLKFKRFIDRFNLQENDNKVEKVEIQYEENTNKEKIDDIKNEILENKIMFYFLLKDGIAIYSEKENKSYYIKDFKEFKSIFEDSKVLKCGYKQREEYVNLWEKDIKATNLMFDVEIAGYILNSNISKYTIEYLANEYMRFGYRNIYFEFRNRCK